MYEEFFGFSRRPFTTTPALAAYVPLESIEQARAALETCVRSGQGIGVVTGPAGTGKSLLCLRLRDALRDRFVPVLLSNANLPTRRALLQAILYELDQPGGRLAAQELRIALQDHLRTVRPDREGIALIVDEAHLLSDRLLEELRTIAQLSADGDPLVRVVLAGQLLLEEKLAEPALEALNQRIVCQASLEPLTQRESAEFLTRRIETAGGEPREVFTSDAAQAICQAADGNPRCLTQLADHALLLAFANEERPVSRGTVLQALDDLRRLPLHWSEPAGEFATAEAERPADGVFEETEGGDAILRDDAPPPEAGDPFDDEPAELPEPILENEFADQEWNAEPAATFEVGHSFGDETAEGDVAVDGNVAVDSATETNWNAESIARPPVMDDPSFDAGPLDDAALDDGPFDEAPFDEAPFDARPVAEPPFVPPPVESALGKPPDSYPVKDEPAPPTIEEQPVVDRYAMLDAGLPFPDEPRTAPRGLADRPAASPDRRIDAMLPLLDEALRPLAGRDRGGMTPAGAVPVIDVDMGESDSHQAIEPFAEAEGPVETAASAIPVAWNADDSDPTRDERGEVEDGEADGGEAEDDSFEARLGNEVLEVCLETQQVLDARLAATEPPREAPAGTADVHPERSEWDWNADDAEHAAEFGGAPDVGYDVVEPEPVVSSSARAGSAAARPGGRRNYRRLFSALRRRETASE